MTDSEVNKMTNSKKIQDDVVVGVVVDGGSENQKPLNYNNNNNTRRRSEGENNNHNHNHNNNNNNHNNKRLRNDDQGGTNTNSKQQQQQQQQRLVPPDGGWGWMVALGTFLVTMLLPTMSPCFGVLFSQYLISENTSSTVTAWIFNTQAFIWNSSGILGRPLSRELGWRRVGVTGAFFAAFGLGCSALMPSPLYLFLTFSCMAGVGGGLVTSLCFTILPRYFDRKRGIATAVMMGGICFGQIVGPPVARLLQEEYGYKGATLILGAILLHSCIGVSFFRPPEWYLKPSNKEEEVEEKVDYNKKGEKLLINKELTRVLLEADSDLPRTESAPGDLELEGNIPGILARKRMSSYPGIRRLSRTSLSSIANSAMNLSTLDVGGRVATWQDPSDDDDDDEDDDNESGNRNNEDHNPTCSIFTRVLKSTRNDLRILKSPRACIICLGATLFINGYLNFLMMVPFALTSAGYSLDLAAWCLSASAVANFICRILTSSLSDARWFKIRVCYMTGFLILFGVTFVFPFVKSPEWLIVTLILFGCGVGSSMGLHNLVMIDVMGIDQLEPVFGSTSLSVGIGFICVGPVIGFIRDQSGRYSVSIWMVSALFMLGFLLWLLMPLATRFDHARDRKRRQLADEGVEAEGDKQLHS